MPILFGLFSAIAYGIGDFAAGIGSRRMSVGLVAVIVQVFSLISAVIGVLIFSGVGPTSHVLLWGAISGIGSAIGTLALYRGLAVGQMSVVSPLSAVIAAVAPVFVGVAQGEYLSVLSIAGIGIAVPAIGLVSWHRSPVGKPKLYTGLTEGILSGLGFALLFIALNQAGTQSGAWPLIPCQTVGFLILLPFGWRARCHFQVRTSSTALAIGAGLLSGTANLFFLAAIARGQLSIVAILTSLYPAVTIIFARIILGEKWSLTQKIGLLIAAVSVAFISAG